MDSTIKIDTDKVEAALASSIIGDVLGWPQERLDKRLDKGKKDGSRFAFKEWSRRSGTRFNAYIEELNAGEYSDDSQLLLMTARSLLKGANWSRYMAAQELPLWLLYERGAGRTVSEAAKSWSEGIAPWGPKSKMRELYFQSGANGAVMRVLPHALLSDISDEEVLNQAMLNSILTHGHPRAILSSLAYVLAARFLLRKENKLELGELITFLLEQKSLWSKIRPWQKSYAEWIDAAQKLYDGKYEELWRKTVEEIEMGLLLCEKALQEGPLASTREFLETIGAFKKESSGSGVVALLASVYVFSFFVNNYHTGLLELGFAEGADTDTLASLAGGLFGCFWGKQWIHQDWLNYQDSLYVNKLAKDIAQSSFHQYVEENSEFTRWNSKNNDEIINKLLVSKLGDSIKFGILGDSVILEKFDMKPIVKKWTHITWKIRTETGQTIYISKQQANLLEKIPKQKATSAAGVEKLSTASLVGDINNILSKYHITKKISATDIIVTDKTVSDLGFEFPKLSEIIISYYWPSIPTATVYHYTTKDAAESILKSATFRLTNLSKRYNEGEIITFCESYKLDGYLKQEANGEPRYKKLLLPSFYYASFAGSNLGLDQEEHLWNRFAPVDGVRLKFKITAYNPNFRKIYYEGPKDKTKGLLNDLICCIEQKYNRKFIFNKISTLCAFYLSKEDYGVENEYRIFYQVSPGLGPQPKKILIDDYIELPLGEMTEIGFQLDILEVYANEKPTLPINCKFVKRI